MSTCGVCHQNPGIRGGIVNGVFYPDVCSPCLHGVLRPQVNPGYKRDAALDDHAKDVIQPWLKNGQPNPDFAHAYPDIARDTYSQEQLEEML